MDLVLVVPEHKKLSFISIWKLQEKICLTTYRFFEILKMLTMLLMIYASWRVSHMAYLSNRIVRCRDPIEFIVARCAVDPCNELKYQNISVYFLHSFLLYPFKASVPWYKSEVFSSSQSIFAYISSSVEIFLSRYLFYLI